MSEDVSDARGRRPRIRGGGRRTRPRRRSLAARAGARRQYLKAGAEPEGLNEEASLLGTRALRGRVEGDLAFNLTRIVHTWSRRTIERMFLSASAPPSYEVYRAAANGWHDTLCRALERASVADVQKSGAVGMTPLRRGPPRARSGSGGRSRRRHRPHSATHGARARSRQRPCQLRRATARAGAAVGIADALALAREYRNDECAAMLSDPASVRRNVAERARRQAEEAVHTKFLRAEALREVDRRAKEQQEAEAEAAAAKTDASLLSPTRTASASGTRRRSRRRWPLPVVAAPRRIRRASARRARRRSLSAKRRTFAVCAARRSPASRTCSRRARPGGRRPGACAR